MELNRNIKHHYNIKDMEVGDLFMGCNKCWFQIPPGSACKNECPNCDMQLMINIVRGEDKK